jgi:hypothetical protein
MELGRGKRHVLAVLLVMLGVTDLILAGVLGRRDFIIDACDSEDRVALQLQIKPLHASVCSVSDPAHACFNEAFVVRISLLQGVVLLSLALVVLSSLLGRINSRLLSCSLVFWGAIAGTGLLRILIPPRHFDFSLTLWPVVAAFFFSLLALLVLVVYWRVCHYLRCRQVPIRILALVLLLNVLVSSIHLWFFLVMAACI